MKEAYVLASKTGCGQKKWESQGPNKRVSQLEIDGEAIIIRVSQE